jgi:lysophospholipase L1-like esterase
MARMARDVGVPEQAIREERVSTSTWENGAMAAPLLRGWGMRKLVLVSDRLHLRRAAGVFTHLGFEVTLAAVPIPEGHGDNVSMLLAGLREFAALGFYRMRGWIGPAVAPISFPPNVAAAGEPADAPSDKPLVLLGASYAKGWSLQEVGGVPVVNRGAGGELTSDMLGRFDRDVVAEHPQAVLVWGFINDVFRAAPDAVDAELARSREHYDAMIARSRQHGIVPILATEIPAGNAAAGPLEPLLEVLGAIRGKEAYADRINRHVAAMNQWLIETARREQLLLLDLGAVLAEPGGRRHPAFTQSDGSHITAVGYETLTSFAVPLLEEFFVDR